MFLLLLQYFRNLALLTSPLDEQEMKISEYVKSPTLKHQMMIKWAFKFLQNLESTKLAW